MTGHGHNATHHTHEPQEPQAASGYLASVDPRLRVAAAVLLAVVLALAQGFPALLLGLAGGGLAVAFSGLGAAAALRRLLPLNAVLLLMWLVLPWSTPGEPLVAFGPLGIAREGLRLAAVVTLKANAIVLWLMTLVGTMEVSVLGHALSHFRVPQKLAHMLLFTVRYLDVLQQEYLRLRAAMKVRGFRPGLNRHTYRSLGYLAGMLLVRSFDRSERIAAAMKCRGFSGQFWLLDHFALSRRDAPFALVAALLLAALIACEIARLL
jgi:cobalt/nickel transport system permease protein